MLKNLEQSIHSQEQNTFNPLDREGVLNDLLERQLSILDEKLDSALSEKLLAIGEAVNVATILKNNKEIDYEKIAKILIKKEEIFFVINHIESFPGINRSMLLDKLIQLGKVGFAIHNNLDKFGALDLSMAIKLIENGLAIQVAHSINQFPKSNHKLIADKLLASNDASVLAYTIDKFEDVDESQIALELMNKDVKCYDAICNNLVRFKNLNNIVSDKLIERGLLNLVVICLESFPEINRQLIFEKLIDTDNYELFFDNWEKFKAVPINYIKFAQHLITSGYGKILVNNIEKFDGLTKEALFELTESNPRIKNALVANGNLKEAVRQTTRLESLAFVLSDLSKENSALLSHPELVTALESNKQYGYLLIDKFNELDSTAQEGILFLVNTAETIKEYSSSQGSVLRQSMQERMAEYKLNSSTQEAIMAFGLNLESWLNFDLQETITLEPQENLESIKVSLNRYLSRICNEVLRFHSIVKEILTGFKSELLAHTIESGSSTKLLEQKQKLQEAIAETRYKGDNESKLTNMQNALAKLDEQLEVSSRPISLWDSANGDLSAMRLAAEKFLKNANGSSHIKLSKNDLASYQNMAQQLMRQFKKIEAVMVPNLSATLGRERMVAIHQEISSTFAEGYDHIYSDLESIRSLAEISQKKVNPLIGRELVIKLWDRNPSMDLYLGNYTNCCIRIDSDYHGTESPIVDYMLDPAIQVLEVIDTQTKKPVVAAWLYLGKHKKKNQTALVIDNIEADTNYSGSFSEQIERSLLAFLSRYAQACGISKISQGELNNDLIVTKTETKYLKLGHYNRPTGYYLEAEPDIDNE